MCKTTMAMAMAIVAAGCDPAGNPARAQQDSTNGEASSASVVGVPAAASREGCPSMGPLVETFDATGTPLIFDFHYPAGFAVRSAEDIGEGLYKIELVREGEGPNPGAISVLQLPSPGAGRTPPGIPTTEQVARSPALQALRETLPKPAETIEFAGAQVATFRAVTDTKVVYKFNLPDGDRYQTVDVHFYPPGGPDNCVPMMEVLAAEWVGQLDPRRH